MSIIRKSSSKLSGSLLNLVAADGSFGNIASFVGNSGRTVLTLKGSDISNGVVLNISTSSFHGKMMVIVFQHRK